MPEIVGPRARRSIVPACHPARGSCRTGPLRRFPTIVVTAALLSGCATLAGRKQRLRVVTRPAAAEVRDEDVTPLATAPAIVEVPRASRRRLELRAREGEPRALELEADYRWGGSLGANAPLLLAGPLWWLAPVGVGVDLLSGAAWSYTPPAPVVLADGAPRPWRIVVVPPLADRELVSDTLGDRLGAWAAARWPDAEVVRLDTVADRLAEFDWTSEGPTPATFRDDVLFELGATHVLHAEVHGRADGALVTTRLEDAFAPDAPPIRTDLLYGQEVVDMRARDAGAFARDLLVGLVPNSVAFDVTSPTITIDAERTVGSETTALDATQPPTHRFLRLLSGFTVRNIRSSVVRGAWDLDLDLGPSIAASWTTLDFDGAPHRVEWVQIAGGIGPVGSLETPLGSIYLSLVPQLDTSYLWADAEREASRFDTALRFEGELGWLFFVSRRVSVRLFARGVTVSAKPLQRVLEEADAPDAELRVDRVQYAVGGISLGFTLPEMRSAVKRLFR